MLTYAAHNVGKIEFNGDQPLARGPKIAEFEAALCKTVGAEHAVAVNSGTSALYVACAALGFGGKRVAVPSITFCGTANAVIMAGGTPIYADVGLDGNISTNWLVGHANQYDAILPVHYAGNLCDLARIRNMFDGLILVDACHALGASDLMRYADAICLSFHPAKQITTGEGGAILTNDQSAAFRMRSLRHNGIVSTYVSGVRQNVWAVPSLNFWMSDVNAAMGIEQLGRLAGIKRGRAAMAHAYYKSLPSWCNPCVDIDDEYECAWAMFPVLIDADILNEIPRYAIMTEMLRRGIETQIHYHPLHLHLAGKGDSGMLPGAEDFGARELTLPLHNRMDVGDVLRVCRALKEIHG